jgi:hypothetical protein
MPWEPITGIDGFVLRPWSDSAWIDEGYPVATGLIETDGTDVVRIVGVPDGGDRMAFH